MSPYITTKHKHLYESRHNTSQESVRLLVSLNITAIALAVCAAFAYVWMLNRLVSDGYVIKDLEERLVLLHETGEGLNREITALRSPVTLSGHAASLGLISAEKVSYSKTPPAVARSNDFMLP